MRSHFLLLKSFANAPQSGNMQAQSPRLSLCRHLRKRQLRLRLRLSLHPYLRPPWRRKLPRRPRRHPTRAHKLDSLTWCRSYRRREHSPKHSHSAPTPQQHLALNVGTTPVFLRTCPVRPIGNFPNVPQKPCLSLGVGVPKFKSICTLFRLLPKT